MRVAIQAKQRRAAVLQQDFGVSAGAERGVDDEAPLALAQQSAHLGQHHRQMQPIRSRIRFRCQCHHHLQIELRDEFRIHHLLLGPLQDSLQHGLVPKLKMVD